MFRHSTRRKQSLRLTIGQFRPNGCLHKRNFLHVDARNRLSTFWTPTTGPIEGEDYSHSLLIRGGFIRQAYSGVFHFLPLGLRVQEKLDRLIDKHMRSIGASKLSLSTITSEALWRQTGRFDGGNSELISLNDRKESNFLLSPTHEEEITALAASTIQSYKELPLRVYQITRKYRDELRPRQGLLRAKEFLMKDLYTFDHSEECALETYESVREAYTAFFDELKIPYLVSEADSGNMGGKLNHEYHFVSPKGEDHVCACNKCNYIANEEIAEQRTVPGTLNHGPPQVWTGISKDKNTLVRAYFPLTADLPSKGDPSQLINIHAIKSAFPTLDAGVAQDKALEIWQWRTNERNLTDPNTEPELQTQSPRIIQLFDHRVSQSPSLHESIDNLNVPTSAIVSHPETGNPLTLTKIYTGSPCPRCEDGTLTVHRTIEVGHTFHLGTRYSEPLSATIAAPDSPTPIPMQMGCHGLGVSRLVGTIAAVLADSHGLNWPRAVAPFEAVVIPGRGVDPKDADIAYDEVASPPFSNPVDVVLDDRDKELGWKLRDADLIGYPIVIVLGRAWKGERKVEVQCRREDHREEVHIDDVGPAVQELLERL